MEVLKKLATVILIAAAISNGDDAAEAPQLYGRKLVDYPRVYADVFNWMPNGALMKTWCKSQNDDIGFRSVPTHTAYSWSFYPSFAGTTVYSCEMTGEHGHVGFDAYDFKRDNVGGRCATECKWNATTDGVHGFNERTRAYDIFYPWGK